MPRKHILVVALALGLAAAVGTAALTNTVRLGQASGSSGKAADRLVAKRAAQLDRFEASLRRQLQQKPPALPPRPKPVTPVVAPAPTAAAPTQRVVYVRPAPIVIHKHRAGGEHESEHESEHGEGGGGDD